ncbi:hypothetical protein J6590_105186, partial [Homalodisca vitripennis]
MCKLQSSAGTDVPNAESLYSVLKEDTSVKLFFVSQSDIDEIQNTLPDNLKPIPGTRSIHQVVTNSYGHINYRPLLCFCAANDWFVGQMCNCQIPLKTYNYTGLENESNKPAETSTPGKPSTSKKRESFYKNVYSSSDEECESVQYMESDNEEINISDMINSTDPNYDTNLPILETQTSTNVRQGVLVLVKVLGGARKKTNYQYVA